MKFFSTLLFWIILTIGLSAQGVFKLADNGVTVTCNEASFGEKGIIEGVTYTAVHRSTLIDSIAAGADLTKLCTSKITDMYDLFANNAGFNQDIGNWDVSSVKDMDGLFYQAKKFNQDLSHWDVSSVGSFARMFFGAEVFDQPIGNWDLSSAYEMHGMFFNAKSFNQDIGDWNVEKVIRFYSMFNGAESFNQDIGNWNVISGVNFNYMFNNAASFNQFIGDWNMSNAKAVASMFVNAISFNQDIGNWDLKHVVRAERMFSGAISFNQDIGDWNFSSIPDSDDLEEMFKNATAFNQDLSNWCVPNALFEPSGFALNSPLESNHYPIWGTCPNSTSNEEIEEVLTNYGLDQNYPNPFNPSTNITFDLPKAVPVELRVYNMLGQEVTLLLDEVKSAGSHQVSFDASGLTSGTYFYMIKTPQFTQVKQMILIK